MLADFERNYSGVFPPITILLFRAFYVSIGLVTLQVKFKKVRLGQISLTQNFELSKKNPGVTFLQVIPIIFFRRILTYFGVFEQKSFQNFLNASSNFARAFQVGLVRLVGLGWGQKGKIRLVQLTIQRTKKILK